MKSEKYPRIDPDLVKLLEESHPPLPYDPEIPTEEFIRRLAFRAGQVELILKLKTILNKQKEGGF